MTAASSSAAEDSSLRQRDRYCADFSDLAQRRIFESAERFKADTYRLAALSASIDG